MKKTYAAKAVLFMMLVLIALLIPTTRVSAYQEECIGVVPELFKGQDSMLSGTALGYAAADALRSAAGTDFAVVNGGNLAQNLQGGPTTWSDVCGVFHKDDKIGVTQVTPYQMKELLEIAVSGIAVGEDDAVIREVSESAGFIQPSGFSYRYDVSAPPGQRILEVFVTSDEKSLDLTDNETVYTLAGSETMLNGGYLFPVLPYETLGITMTQALAQAVSNGTLTMSTDNRVVRIGSADTRIIDALPFGMVPFLAILFGAFRYKKNRDYDFSFKNHHNVKGYERPSYYKN